jgi:hypothetical protein
MYHKFDVTGNLFFGIVHFFELNTAYFENVSRMEDLDHPLWS